VNIGDPWPDLDEAELRVHAMQTKLHQWAISDPDRCFDDLYNLVYDPAFLVVAWSRVRYNKRGRSAGVDGVVPRSIVFSAGEFLTGLVDELKSRRFTPTSVREKMIPKANGKLRRLGIPTAADRTVQGSLKLALNRSSRRASSHAAMASARSAEPKMLSPRFTTSEQTLATTSGSSRPTSKRASTRSTTRPSWAGCDVGSGTSASWAWSTRS
jgi:hypothetical protein